MKKILIQIALLCALLSPLSVIAKPSSTKYDMELKDSLLWKISGKDLPQPSYLYGTMHIVCETETFAKAKVDLAINNSEQLYLELDMDDPAMMLELMKLGSAGDKVKDIKDEATKQKLLALAEKHLGLKASLLQDSSMFYLMSMTAMKAFPSCGTAPSSIEQKLLEVFINKNQEILGLETAQEQMEFVAQSGMMDAEVMLKSFEVFAEMKRMMQAMVDMYESEEVSDLFRLMATPNEYMSAEDVDKMLQVILITRNKNWVEKIPAIAKDKATFFAVGVGHLGGNIGVIHLLREQGYTVEAVMD